MKQMFLSHYTKILVKTECLSGKDSQTEVLAPSVLIFGDGPLEGS